jgi:SPP1 family predicted phage head-tail adaptor
MSLFPIKDLGELDRRITILEAYTQTDLFGQSVRTMGQDAFVNEFGERVTEDGGTIEGTACVVDAIDSLPGVITQVWAKVEYMSGKEGEESNRLEAVKRVEFGIRYNSAINEKMQISWDGDIFEIEAVLPIERKRFMHLVTRLVD